jgi:hypothetical protein
MAVAAVRKSQQTVRFVSQKGWPVLQEMICVPPVQIIFSDKATVAQLVEHLTRNEDVCGSIPHSGSNYINRYITFCFSSSEKDCKIPPITAYILLNYFLSLLKNLRLIYL